MTTVINSRDLRALRADVRVNVETLLRLCAEQGLDVLITQTVRDDEYQAYLYAQGRTRPGAIVTNSKTTTFHGKGLAVDFCQNIRGHEYDDAGFFRNVATIAKGIGFSWGGDWKSFVDMPHLQWDNHGKYTTAMLRAGLTAPMMPKWEEQTKEEEDENVKRFNEIKEMPSWAQDTIRKLTDKQILTGSGGVRDEDGRPADLNLSEDMLRIFVINDRAGVYK